MEVNFVWKEETLRLLQLISFGQFTASKFEETNGLNFM